MPLVPSLDWQQIKNSLKPLLLQPQLHWTNILHDTVAWAVVACLWITVIPSRRSDRYLFFIVPVIFGLEILIVRNVVSASNVVGAALGLGLWWILLRFIKWRTTLLAFLIASVLVVNGLAPFELRVVSGSFHLLPFRGFLGGSMFVNTASIFDKFFLYGSFLWLVRQGGASLKKATVFGVGLTTLIEIGQVFVTNHTAEITDPLLVLIIAGMIYAIDNYHRPAAES